MTTNRRDKPHKDEVLAAEAENIAQLSRATIHRFIAQQRIRARLLRNGERRYWAINRADVEALREAPKLRRLVNQRMQLWRRYFGKLPNGYKPAFRDGDHRNVAPENMCLVPRPFMWRKAARGERRRASPSRIIWTKAMLRQLTREYPRSTNKMISAELGVSEAVIRRKAKALRLRKTRRHLSDAARKALSLPIGTERYKPIDKQYFVKALACDGVAHIWRLKHHLIWEVANGQPLPKGMRVIFVDGDRHNFDPKNLRAVSKEEASALANIRFHSYPKNLKDSIRLATRIKHEAWLQLRGSRERSDQPKRRSNYSPKGRKMRRWTPAMDAVLRRDYPVRPRSEVATALGTTETALRIRASKLMIQREPQAILAEARARAVRKVALTPQTPSNPSLTGDLVVMALH